MVKKAALVVVDMQKEFFGYKEAQKSLNEALEYINYTIDKFRAANQPIVFIADEEAGGGIDSEGYQLYEELDFRSDDILISKRFCNSFWETNLEAKLKELDVELVVICGFAAEYCIYNTYHGAQERNFKAVVLQHGIASTNEQYIAMVEKISNSVSYPVLECLLR